MKSIEFERYPEYKESGVEWLGEIPKHWEILPSKRYHKIFKKINSKKLCDNILSLTLRGVVNNDIDNPEGLVPKDYKSYQIFEKDNLVFKLIDLENEKTSRVGIVHELGIMSPAYIRMIIGKDFLPKYSYYYYYSLYLNLVYNKIGQGVRSTLNPSDLLKIFALKPKYSEQVAISKFLDEKCNKIDKVISQKEKLIKLLNERKQIIIQNAVTKGLKSKIEMKDSGDEWLGQVPIHWEISKLKQILSPISIKDKAHLPLLSITRERGIILRDIENMEENHNFIPDDLSGYKMIEKGQFGMNKMKAWQGSYGISEYTGIVSPAYYIFKLIKDINPEFFHLAIRSKIYVPFFGKASDGVRIGQWDLSKSRMNEIPFIIPPLEEQEGIVYYIEEESKKIDNAVLLQEKQIQKLKEYREILIDNVVTGKIKVGD